DADLLLNRLVLLAIAVGCLALLCVSFNPVRELGAPLKLGRVRGLTAAHARRERAILPAAFGERWDPLVASIGLELRLLRDERSLIAILPAAVATTILGPIIYGVRAATPGLAPSASYAYTTANTLLL